MQNWAKRFWSLFFPISSTQLAPLDYVDKGQRFNPGAFDANFTLDALNPLNAYQKISTIRQCVSLISRQISTFPLKFQKKAMRKGKEVWIDADTHPSYEFVTGRPNEYMTNIDFRGALLVNFLLWGNAYARIYWNKSTGRIEEVWPLRSDTVIVDWDGIKRSLVYKVPAVDPDGFVSSDDREVLMPYEVLHIKNLSSVGWYGISPITAAIQDIEGDLIAREYQRRNLEKAIPAGILSMAEEGNQENYKSEIDLWKDNNAGLNNLGIAALGPNMQFNAVRIPQGDRAWIESREFYVKDLSAFYHVPLHKINRMDQSTFGNVAMENKDFHDNCLENICTIFNQAYEWAFLYPSEYKSKKFKIFHDVDVYLRADVKSRAEVAAIHVANGIRSRNAVCEDEGFEPFDGGEIHTVQVNMVDITKLPEPTPAEDQQDNNAAPKDDEKEEEESDDKEE